MIINFGWLINWMMCACVCEWSPHKRSQTNIVRSPKEKKLVNEISARRQLEHQRTLLCVRIGTHWGAEKAKNECELRSRILFSRCVNKVSIANWFILMLLFCWCASFIYISVVYWTCLLRFCWLWLSICIFIQCMRAWIILGGWYVSALEHSPALGYCSFSQYCFINFWSKWKSIKQKSTIKSIWI